MCNCWLFCDCDDKKKEKKNMEESDKKEMLRIINRHKARTLSSLEDIDCPDAYLVVFRNGFDWMKSDLVNLVDDVIESSIF